MLQENSVLTTGIYDYFCGEAGTILQKRSLDENGKVVLIVDMSYSGDAVTETAWSPESNVTKTITHKCRRLA